MLSQISSLLRARKKQSEPNLAVADIYTPTHSEVRYQPVEESTNVDAKVTAQDLGFDCNPDSWQNFSDGRNERLENLAADPQFCGFYYVSRRKRPDEDNQLSSRDRSTRDVYRIGQSYPIRTEISVPAAYYLAAYGNLGRLHPEECAAFDEVRTALEKAGSSGNESSVLNYLDGIQFDTDPYIWRNFVGGQSIGLERLEKDNRFHGYYFVSRHAPYKSTSRQVNRYDVYKIGESEPVVTNCSAMVAYQLAADGNSGVTTPENPHHIFDKAWVT